MAQMFHPQMLKSAMAIRRPHCPGGTLRRSPPVRAMAKSPAAPATRHRVRNRIGAISVTASFIMGQLKPQPRVRPISSQISVGGKVCAEPVSRIARL
jgi:hypothetical protein